MRVRSPLHICGRSPPWSAAAELPPFFRGHLLPREGRNPGRGPSVPAAWVKFAARVGPRSSWLAKGSDPSPGPRRLVKTPSRSTLSPRERAVPSYKEGSPILQRGQCHPTEGAVPSYGEGNAILGRGRSSLRGFSPTRARNSSLACYAPNLSPIEGRTPFRKSRAGRRFRPSS